MYFEGEISSSSLWKRQAHELETTADGTWKRAWAVKDYKRSTQEINYLSPEFTRPPNVLR